MKKQGIFLIGVAFVALIVVIILFLARLTLTRLPEVALAEPDGTHSGQDTSSGPQQDSIRRVEVTPETVQLVIERLARPETYSRTLTIERRWAGGNGECTIECRVFREWARTDLTEGSETRHVVTGGGKSYIWYNEDVNYFTGASVLTADEEQNIPTYEDILRLPSGTIAAADYRLLGENNCIYVETTADPEGYTQRFWISVDNGLLVAAERLLGEETVYRMTGTEDDADVAADAFTLPDGTVLCDPGAAEGEANINEG